MIPDNFSYLLRIHDLPDAMVSVQLGFLRRRLRDLVLEVRIIKSLGQGRGDLAHRVMADDQAILVVRVIALMNLFLQASGFEKILEIAFKASPNVKLSIVLADDGIKTEF